MPANPTPYQDSCNGELYCDQQGLTKREHFAALAMQAMISNRYYKDFCADGRKITGQNDDQEAIKALAYKQADVMCE
jgi:hypothetical protein